MDNGWIDPAIAAALSRIDQSISSGLIQGTRPTHTLTGSTSHDDSREARPSGIHSNTRAMGRSFPVGGQGREGTTPTLAGPERKHQRTESAGGKRRRGATKRKKAPTNHQDVP